MGTIGALILYFFMLYGAWTIISKYYKPVLRFISLLPMRNKIKEYWDRSINLPAITKWKIFSGVVVIFFVTLFIAIYVSIYRLSSLPPLPDGTPVPIETSIHSPDAPFATPKPTELLPTPINESNSGLSDQTGDDATSHTYVLLGNDFRSNSADRFENTQQSDAFIIVHVSEGKVTLISVARELIIKGYEGMDENVKVSQIYAHNGFEGVERFVEDVFGLDVNGVVATDLNRFPQIVDAVEGVDLTPSASVYERCGDEDIYYEGDVEVHMDGAELLCYARGRLYSPIGYFDRQERHFEVINALWQKMQWALYDDPLRASMILISEFMPLVDTNMSGDDMFFLVVEFIVVFSGFENDFDVELVSMDRSVLKLYARNDENDPFLYYPTVNLKEWTQDAINGVIND